MNPTLDLILAHRSIRQFTAEPITDIQLDQILSAAQAAEFLLFCADYHRHCEVVPDAQTGFVEQLLIGAIDGALMAQNALLAAQSMGLGGVYIGGIRNNPAAVSESGGAATSGDPAVWPLSRPPRPGTRTETPFAPCPGGA